MAKRISYETVKLPAPVKTNSVTAEGVINYGAHNNYPQVLLDIIDGSATLAGCLRTYKSFIYGSGIKDLALAASKVNAEISLDDLLDLIGDDFAKFGAFAIHVNYTISGDFANISHIPFEHTRLYAAKGDMKMRPIGVAIYDDWTRKYRTSGVTDIDFLPFYNPDNVLAEIEAVGINDYKGQVFYSAGKSYPKPIYHSILTNGSSEAGLFNIIYREVREGMIGTAILVQVDSLPADDAQKAAEQDMFQSVTGDENAASIIVARVADMADSPKLLPLQTEKIVDKYIAVKDMVPEWIATPFAQPEVLRGKALAAGFADDNILPAYNFYNTQTERERQKIERALTAIFMRWKGVSIEIAVKNYEANYKPEQIISMVENRIISPAQGRKMLGIEEEVQDDNSAI